MMNILTLSSISNAYTSGKFEDTKKQSYKPPRNTRSNNASAGLANSIHEVFAYWRNTSRSDSLPSPSSAGSASQNSANDASANTRQDLRVDDSVTMNQGILLSSPLITYSSAVSPAHARFTTQLSRRPTLPS